MKQIGKKILTWEAQGNFTPRWYSLLINPYFISRSSLYRAVNRFASQCSAGGTILDVGCGSQPYRHLFASQRYIGIDIEGGGHSQSQKNVEAFFDGQHIPYGDASFDAVIITEVLEHADDPVALIREINRVLKADGKLLVTMPFVWDEHEQPYDFRRFTRFEHQRLLERNGFRVVSIQKTTGIFATTGQLISAFLIELFAGGLDRMKLKFRYSYPLKKICTLVVCFPLQLLGLALDVVFRHRGITLDYVVIAQTHAV
ncbi:MAG: hypothetical protein A3J59_02340 [Candidatus Buchananbacteria bacterium RIFCSPHIGHO2_02_FULL_56_16]|uniref:Methyltransferase type 11 domain-containing protein n=1 Tax=Candidatus Buchananbacteria bacterium RIFCSPHIGHO2_02_FULL_56_16 TaxID=1797542 RepID=A0A1G1YHL6_9BACT|nr:MAG: hypothetical protein A3J59_02340 [Candidatus Buchananbacteria bacterium RIFCSPHIGHO2_02_FULL_56_16]